MSHRSSPLKFQTDYPEYGLRDPVLTSENVNWNLFALEQHSQPVLELPEHYHAQHMISIHLDANPNHLELGMDEGRESVRWHPGDIFIVPAYVNHTLAWCGRSEFMVLNIEPEKFRQSLNEFASDRDIELIPQFTKQDPLLHQLGLTLKTELETGISGSRLYTDMLSNAILMHLLRHYTEQQSITEYSGRLSKVQLAEVLDYIDTHLNQNISLSELAAIVHMGSRHFSRCFKQSMGFSPYQYLIKCRVDRAEKLLRQPHSSITKIAETVGFANQSHLNRHFKRWLGVSPRSVQSR
jgi:AraC family transcriptional regulator